VKYITVLHHDMVTVVTILLFIFSIDLELMFEKISISILMSIFFVTKVYKYSITVQLYKTRSA